MNPMVEKKLEKIRKILASEVGKEVWDVLTALRGPDFPSERPDQGYQENAAAYAARRRRKYSTSEIIRAVAGLKGGSCRYHTDDKVYLPPNSQWDHFDKHVAKAAAVLGLKIVIQEEDGTGVDPCEP